MIDLSQLTEEQLNELELQIQQYKEQQNVKDALENLKGYKVTFYVRFDPEKHKDNDMLTDDGELDPNIFADYLCDNVASKLIMDFDFGDYEDVSYPNVEVATKQEIEHQF
jgi:arabinogalactan endo-1,4-beta-galactosidase